MPKSIIARETGLLTADWLDNLIVIQLLPDEVLLGLTPEALQIVKINLVRLIEASPEIMEKLREKSLEVATKLQASGL